MTLVTALEGALPSRRTLDSIGVRRWIYLGEDTSWRLAAESGALARLERVPTGEALERAAWELRDPWIEWIGSLSQANTSLEWWACELAAKNPFTLLFPRACALHAARGTIAPGMAPTLAVCPTPAVRAQLEGLAAEAGVKTRREGGRRLPPGARDRARDLVTSFGGRAAGRLAAARSERVRVLLDSTPEHRRDALARLGIAPPGGGFDGTLIFTWADERSVTPQGAYTDPHLGELPALLAARGLPVAYVPRTLPGVPFASIARALAATGEEMFFPDALLEAEDWEEARRRAAGAAFAIPADARVGDLPVARIAREHLDRWRWLQAVSLTFDPLVRRLADAGVRPRLIVFPFEGHAWEQVLVAAVRAHMPGAHIAGYDNVNFSRLALSLYPAPAEIGSRPLPDRIVTNGPTFERVLIDNGLPTEMVACGCALRHAYLWGEGGPAAAAEWPDGPIRVVVAGSIDPGQSVEAVQKAVQAFGGDDRYLVTVKPHPVNEAETRAALAALPSHGNVSFTATPIPELLRDADVLLYTYSVVCYEALAAGVAPVFVKAESFIDLDQLEPFPALRRSARTAEELREAAEEAVARMGAEREEWNRRARAAVAEALAPVGEGCVEAFLP